MKYNIVYGDDMLDLIVKVKKGLNEGWKPQGGVCLGNDGYYYQAMVLES